MSKKIVHIVIGGWLAVLLLFGTTPMEFVHAFAHHTDTVHHKAKKGERFIEQEHHHCSFLSFTLNTFNNNAANFFISFHKQRQHQQHASFVRNLTDRIIPTLQARGPPTLAV